MREIILTKINENKDSTRITLAGMKIQDNEILEIIETIKIKKPDVSMIDLDNNNISDAGALILSERLCDFENIKELSLQFNNIGRDGALEVFGLKNNFCNLDILFRGNKIVNALEMDQIERLALGKGAPKP
ncbi:MAG: hypothetical protein LEGION0403_FIIPPAGN_01105 [Legionella sp.]|uniref:hypothetical protein n=1 Tax=Legionella sp. TaxID=459 RepID=UPI003D0CD552